MWGDGIGNMPVGEEEREGMCTISAIVMLRRTKRKKVMGLIGICWERKEDIKGNEAKNLSAKFIPKFLGKIYLQVF